MTEPHSALPLYAQIAARLREQIREGRHRPGAKIPSEHELSAQFGVGRPTVRQATQVLVDERVLERKRGSGTYVRSAPIEVDLFAAGGTLAALAESGLELETKLLGKVRLLAVPEAARPSFASSQALGVVRLSTLAGTPVLLEEMYFEPEVFPGLDRLALAGRSLSELARERYALSLTSVAQRFGVNALSAARAASLGLQAGAHALHVQRTLDFRTAKSAVFAELFFRTDQVEFSQRLSFPVRASSDASLEMAREARAI